MIFANKFLPYGNLQFGTIYVASNSESAISAVARAATKIGTLIELKTQVDPHVDGLFLAARRFNAANAGKIAHLKCNLPGHVLEFIDLTEALQIFIDYATDIAEPTSGDLEIGEYVEWCARIVEEETDTHRSTKRPMVLKTLKNIFAREVLYDIPLSRRSIPSSRQAYRKDEGEDNSESVLNGYAGSAPAPSELPEDSDWQQAHDLWVESKEEEAAILKQEAERRRALNNIRADIIKFITTYHTDPQKFMAELLGGKVIINGQGYSRLVVNGDLKLVLSDYDEMEVELYPASKTVYLLFLLHPEGIVLKDISDYKEELRQIYAIVKPGASDKTATRAVDAIVNEPERLQQHISRIRRSFHTRIMGPQLEQYCITGTPKMPYKITLDRSLVTMPRVLTA